MQHLTAVLACMSAVIATPSAAQNIPAMMLTPGEALTVRVVDAGTTSSTRHRADWSAFDIFAARHLTGLTPPDAPVPTATPYSSGQNDMNPEPIPAGEVRVRFLSIDGKHSLLVVENGLAVPIAYRARMTVGGRIQPTDVCQVMAGLPSYEHWPHPIEKIELTDFRYTTLQPGQPPSCA